jgi:HIV Tat-specific factor 1
VQFFPENPSQGIVKIKFSSSLHAQQCIDLMNGRFFDGRALVASFWDGKTDYRIVRETKEEIE